jgi:beta-lactamase regulating signal transducer with metallopeptidase domain
MIVLAMIALTTTAAFILNAIPLSAIAKASALQIVNCLIEGTLIAIVAGAVLRAARLQNSNTKFAVWFSALMGIAALPALAGVSSSVAWGGIVWTHATNIPAQTLSHSAITLPGSWALYVFAAWAAIAGWFLLGLARSLWHLHVLRKNCIPVDPASLEVRLRETLARSGSLRAVELCTSERVNVPTAIGLMKPAVILPSWVMQELSAEELNQILLHELAHLQRWDDWTNLAQKLVKALFFFHPAVWWIEKQVSLEREMACDDAVVAETASPRAYAECLARLAEKTLLQRNLVRRNLGQRSVALAQAALGRIRQTSLRVAQILDGNRRAGAATSWKPAVAFVAAFAIACVALISKAPRLISFRDSDVTPFVGPAVARISPIRNVSAPNIPAELTAWNAISERPVDVVQAGLKVHQAHRSFNSSPRAVAMQSPASAPVPNRVIQTADQPSSRRESTDQASLAEAYFRLADAKVTPVAFTETLFVVIEGPGQGSSDQPVFQIQWWRVMVLHPVADPDSNRIPPKKT